MLTADLIRPFLRIEGSTILADLLDEANPFWLQTAADLLALFQQCIGKTRSFWEQQLETFEGARIDYLRLRGLAKVLSDEAIFAPPPTALSPLDVRPTLFRSGPAFTEQDIFHNQTREEVLQQVAATYGLTPEEVDAAMYADLPAEHILIRSTVAWTPLGLLQRYNLELTRGVLYRATLVHIEIWDNFKNIWRYLKLFHIMYWAQMGTDGNYRLTLSGPLSDFVKTERYGFSFAQFLPALLLGQRWQLRASIVPPIDSSEKGSTDELVLRRRSGSLSYSLDQDCALRSYFKAGREYDSALERTFAQEFLDFETKFGSERGKWQLTREPEILLLKKTVMIPDFLLVHADDPERKILIELVGFWTPTYLRNKLAKIHEAQCTHLLVLVYEHLNVTLEDFQGAASEVIFFKEKPVIKDIMATVEQMAERIYGPLKQSKPERPSLPELVDAAAFKGQWFSLEEMKARFKQLTSDFTPNAYGHKTLSSLVKEHPEHFEVRRAATPGRPLQVKIPEEPSSEMS